MSPKVVLILACATKYQVVIGCNQGLEISLGNCELTMAETSMTRTGTNGGLGIE